MSHSIGHLVVVLPRVCLHVPTVIPPVIEPLSDTSFQIRMTLDDWVVVKALLDELESQNHYDSSFILHKLWFDGAFHLCASSLQQVPSS